MASSDIARLRYDDIEVIAANSFRNFHAKGMDYLCLQRSPGLTVKAYFYDRPDDGGYEVVCPHDHRYPFATTVLAGESGHIRYIDAPPFAPSGRTYQCFDWMTPLNGGSGFEWSREARLERCSTERYIAGETYWCRADEIHTISITEPSTILIVYQLADVVPVGLPTQTFVLGSDAPPPSLDGLYDRMDVDHARKLIARLAPTPPPRPSKEVRCDHRH